MARIRDESRAAWSQRVARWEVSGCPAREFASREGVSEGRLVWWRNKLRKERRQGAMAMAGPRFVELVPGVAVSGPGPALEVVLCSGTVIRVPAGSDDAAAARLVCALERSAA